MLASASEAEQSTRPRPWIASLRSQWRVEIERIWCETGPAPILARMGFLSRINPFRAVMDLRRFLASRGKHEIIFLFAAFVICTLIVGGFVIGSHVPKPYKPPEIIYVQSWRADRTDAEIIAQQKIDAEKKKIQDAKEAQFEAESGRATGRTDARSRQSGSSRRSRPARSAPQRARLSSTALRRGRARGRAP